MTSPGQHTSWILSLPAATIALAITIMLIVVASQPAQAQTFNVIHTFTGGLDGANPYAGVMLDQGGNLYGTAYQGGAAGNGTVYQLKHKGSGWTLNTLYAFAQGGDGDGANPEARVIFGPNGTLYGTTRYGGTGQQQGCEAGCGTVFNLRPFPSVCKTSLCPWMETVLYAFEGYPIDAADPGYGDLLFDQGNIYGTTYVGGSSGLGTVYELTPSGSGWTENILYNFQSSNDGNSPYAGVILDNGDLYGTTTFGGPSGYGTVFELSPSGSGWTKTVVYGFQGGSDGGILLAGLILGPSGNLYGAASYGGSGSGGTVFELTPSGGGWNYTLIYSFTGGGGEFGPYCGPWGTLVIDGAGNLYGTTYCDGAYNLGSVFELTPSGNSWTYTSLHDFTGGNDGRIPISNVVMDASGNLYGTASAGGSQNNGVVWEITP